MDIKSPKRLGEDGELLHGRWALVAGERHRQNKPIYCYNEESVTCKAWKEFFSLEASPHRKRTDSWENTITKCTTYLKNCVHA